MNGRFQFTTRAARAWVAAGAATVLMGTATWHGLGAQPTAATPAATVSTPIAQAVAGGRDSYADVVNVVAPAVVTVHANGRARVSETQFEMPDDFFGQAEFEARDQVHKIGAKAFQTALDERKKGGTRAPA